MRLRTSLFVKNASFILFKSLRLKKNLIKAKCTFVSFKIVSDSAPNLFVKKKLHLVFYWNPYNLKKYVIKAKSKNLTLDRRFIFVSNKKSYYHVLLSII